MASRVTEEEIYGIVGGQIEYDFKMVDLVMDIINRMDGDYSDDSITSAIDNGIMYYSPQWIILQHYCNPQDANWNTAIESFLDDMYSIVVEIQELEDERKADDEEDAGWWDDGEDD